ncbi:hypothetical protein HOO65_050452 [Ceratocystis lukuohia]|uniref:Uncharacterized protein n=1 Tax=Ceratocystis lukuohia TaxID=2019550 RepID=A0ABR4MGF1_9PEZI
MALSQKVSNGHANRGRQIAESFQVGDKVNPRLKNVRTQRPPKKLGIHPVFHVSLVRRKRDGPLPFQVLSDPEPPPTAREAFTDDAIEG